MLDSARRLSHAGRRAAHVDFQVREGTDHLDLKVGEGGDDLPLPATVCKGVHHLDLEVRERAGGLDLDVGKGVHDLDRKSTRLNSSHSQISYAVFCLKKKKA